MERFEDNFSEDELYILYARDILKHTFQQIAITLKTAGFIVWTIYNRTKARQSDLYLKYLKRRTGYLVEDILSGFEPYSNKYYKKNILRVYFLEQQYHGMLDGYRGQKYALRIPLERQPENTMAPEVMDEFYFYLENVRPVAIRTLSKSNNGSSFRDFTTAFGHRPRQRCLVVSIGEVSYHGETFYQLLHLWGSHRVIFQIQAWIYLQGVCGKEKEAEQNEQL